MKMLFGAGIVCMDHIILAKLIWKYRWQFVLVINAVMDNFQNLVGMKFWKNKCVKIYTKFNNWSLTWCRRRQVWAWVSNRYLATSVAMHVSQCIVGVSGLTKTNSEINLYQQLLSKYGLVSLQAPAARSVAVSTSCFQVLWSCAFRHATSSVTVVMCCN